MNIDNKIPLEVKKLFIERLISQGITNKKLLNVISSIPRHLFVESALSRRAYDDDALPIGYGQTISSPYIVGKMTQLLIEDDSMNNVLEIGTGCGYQTAILSLLFKKVTTIERIEKLQTKTKKLLSSFGLKNIKYIHADGHHGYKINQPYDAIIMTASPIEIPDDLIRQLGVTGRMILPLNDKGSQKLFRLKNTKNGILKKEVDDVKFVPMIKGIA